MATNWSIVRGDAIAAAQGVLGATWPPASRDATSAIVQLVQSAQEIDETKLRLTRDELQLLIWKQKVTLQHILMGHAAISTTAALHAVSAVVDTIVAAVPGLADVM